LGSRGAQFLARAALEGFGLRDSGPANAGRFPAQQVDRRVEPTQTRGFLRSRAPRGAVLPAVRTAATAGQLWVGDRGMPSEPLGSLPLSLLIAPDQLRRVAATAGHAARLQPAAGTVVAACGLQLLAHSSDRSDRGTDP